MKFHWIFSDDSIWELMMSKLQMDDGEKNGWQKWRDFEGCVKKLIVKQFLDDRKLADIVSTPVATVSKVLKENYYWGCAEMFAGDNNICMRFVKVNGWFKVCWKVRL